MIDNYDSFTYNIVQYLWSIFFLLPANFGKHFAQFRFCELTVKHFFSRDSSAHEHPRAPAVVALDGARGPVPLHSPEVQPWATPPGLCQGYLWQNSKRFAE